MSKLANRVKARWSQLDDEQKERAIVVGSWVVGVVSYVAWVSWLVHVQSENQPEVIAFGYRMED